MLLQLRGAHAEVVGRRQGHMHRHAPVQPHHRRVAHPGRVENHHLVTVIERRSKGSVDRPLAARRYHKLLWEGPHIVLALQLGADRLQQFRLAKGGWVVGVAGRDGVERSLLDMFGRVSIRLAPGQIDHVQTLRGQFAAFLHHQRCRAARHRLDQSGEGFHQDSPAWCDILAVDMKRSPIWRSNSILTF